ncbi:ATP-binding protein [Aquibacillus albus]|uniref:Uncharacterized protein YhaN n=1 Tax=Aquibacillus albus TaxID=1168171 RepID=A0ABS2MZY3_9BACI|nr:AAA family ATPase [Aquibacillus albus]MBM7571442.1 uncharacterized protein YhaN [Aquibacillus albus]
MKIIQATIFGFGKWQDDQLDFSNRSLVIISGENESGKTTLRQFFLFMLFGLPPKKREFYFPKTGGKMGGRLTVFTEEDGEFTIERIHDRRNGEATCYLSNGDTYQEDWLKAKLKGIDEKTFTSIFSFDSIQLSRLHKISGEELGNVLLGIGLSGTDKIHTIEKKLDNELDSLFKPQGKRPTINKLLNEIDKKHKELIEIEREEKTYNEKKQNLKELSDEFGFIQRECEQIANEKDDLSKRIQAYSMLQTYAELNEQSKQLPDGIRFPENGLERYYSMKDQLLPLNSELSVLRDNRNKYTEEIKAIQKKLLDNETIQHIEELLGGYHTYNQFMNDREYSRQEKDKLERVLTNHLEELKIGLRIDDLQDISFPFHIEEHWSSLKQEREQLTIEKDKMEKEEIALQEQINQFEDEKIKIENQLLDTDALRDLKDKIKKKQNLDRMDALEDLQVYQRRKWKNIAEKRKKTSTTIGVISLIGCILFAILATVLDNLTIYGLSAIFLLAGIIQTVWVHYSLKEMEGFFQESRPPETKTQDHTIELSALEQQLQEQQQLFNQLEMIENQLRQLQVEQLKLDERTRLLVSKQKRLEDLVYEERQTYPFLKGINVSYWQKLYHHLKSCIEKNQQLNHHKEVFHRKKKEMDDFEQKVHLFMKNHSWLSDDSDILPAIHDVQDKIDADKKARSKLLQYQEWVHQTEEQIRHLEQKKIPYEEEVHYLWKITEVTNEEDFIKQGKLKEEMETINKEMEDLQERLKSIFETRDITSIVKEDLKNKWELEQSYEDLKEKQDELEKKLEDKRQVLSDVKSMIRQLEGSEDYSVLKHRFHLEIDQLKQHAKQWAIYQVAKEKLMETKAVYQNNYLPAVMQQATEYFHRLTNGAYVDVYVPMDDHTLQVEHYSGLRYDVQELSQGTRDQLYVALRIALSEVSGKDNNLPFVIDDAFVHFDRQREQTMMDILYELSHRQQVIFFTYQDSLKEFSQEKNSVHLQRL